MSESNFDVQKITNDGAYLVDDEVFHGAFSGVSIDSRTLKPGELFFAIRGERFDGHHFIPEAVTAGAAAVVCEHAIKALAVPQFVVSDTLEALTSYAKRHRQRMSLKVIALTGSNGKTSVKEMIANILPKPAFATQGNFNNHIGVPLSVLKLRPEHRYAVFELGANHPGEIAHTVAMVQPHVTLINNIGPAHIEGFGSIEGVARAKGEIYQGLMPGGTAVVNEGDEYAHFWDQILTNRHVLRFSIDKATPICAKDISYNEAGSAHFKLVTPIGEAWLSLKVPGMHNVSNALAAAACALAVDLDLDAVVNGLQRFTGVPGRMTFHPGKNQAVIIDDTYNANARSVFAALEVLSKRQGTRILVLGDLGELGKYAVQHHEDIGKMARQLGIDHIMTCGQLSAHTATASGERGQHYHEKSALINALIPYLNPHTTVLVKGSRSSAMEKIVYELI